MAPRNIREHMLTLSPPWLRAFWGRRLVGGIAYVFDLMSSAYSQAITAAWIRSSPHDALPSLGADSNIERAPCETNDAYRQRLVDRWTAWSESATEKFAVNALAPLGVPAAAVDVRAHHEWHADPASTHWSRFWILLDGQNADFPWAELKWGKFQWGQGNNKGSFTWGSEATFPEIQSVLRTLDKWKSAHEVGVHVLIDYKGNIWGNPPVWGAFRTWDTGGVVRWPMGSFWGTKYSLKKWGQSMAPWGSPAAWGIKLKV